MSTMERLRYSAGRLCECESPDRRQHGDMPVPVLIRRTPKSRSSANSPQKGTPQEPVTRDQAGDVAQLPHGAQAHGYR